MGSEMCIRDRYVPLTNEQADVLSVIFFFINFVPKLYLSVTQADLCFQGLPELKIIFSFA